MKRFVVSLVLAALVMLGSRAPAAAVLNVVTSIPDLADLARHIGGDLVEVKSLATGVEDIHAVPMKPMLRRHPQPRRRRCWCSASRPSTPSSPVCSRRRATRRSIATVPATSTARSTSQPLEIPTRIDRTLGDQHPMGNPHYNLDPVRMKDAARAIAEGLARNDPEHESTYKQNLAAYLATLDAAIARWQQEAAPLKGKKLVSYHPDMIYFAERFGMDAVGTIELRAGVDATPCAHRGAREDDAPSRR